jgi:hypothetical protein
VVRGHVGIGLDRLVVGVLGEVEGRERDGAQVHDRLGLRADPRVELVGDPETRTGLESRRIIRGDGDDLDSIVDGLQDGGFRRGLGSRCLGAVGKLHRRAVHQEGGEAFAGTLRIGDDRLLQAGLVEVHLAPVGIRHERAHDLQRLFSADLRHDEIPLRLIVLRYCKVGLDACYSKNSKQYTIIRGKSQVLRDYMAKEKPPGKRRFFFCYEGNYLRFFADFFFAAFLTVFFAAFLATFFTAFFAFFFAAIGF